MASLSRITSRQLLIHKFKALVKVGVAGSFTFACIGAWSGNVKFFEQYMVPVLNKIDPERSHKMAIISSKYKLLKYLKKQDSPKLETVLCDGITLSNPIGLAAGFDKNGECMEGLLEKGFGWVEVGSVTPAPQNGNETPRMFRIPSLNGFINRCGFNNDGHLQVFERLVQFRKRNPDSVVGVNLGANKHSPNRVKDYCDGISLFTPLADYFVINVSSPNTPNLRELQKFDNLGILLKSVNNARKLEKRQVPVFLKISPDISDNDIDSICKVVESKECSVEGLIIANTTVARPVISENDTETKSVLMQEGGLSGKPLSKESCKIISKFYQRLNGKVRIVGCGGIFNGQDVFDKIASGANAVQIYTSLMYKGFGVVEQMKEELLHELRLNNCESLQEAVGIRAP